ncbi:transcription elongation factor GreA [uncultured Tyzzerella sp.]|uniref:transcription elongation factor GreA n=1 Tax=uncultured Tyzzerella sp. TaxID=2321398 RepID=UPI002943F7D8|nr:transcription elongation factor GreA [uncultured Tyzzerella sp.]
MNEGKKIILTHEGLENLEQELQELKVVRRKDVAAKIKEARGQGDLSENAEYDAAKEEQAEIESRIITIENMLRNAEVIDSGNVTDTVSIGNKIKLFDSEFEEEIEYTLVGSAEADPFNGKISNESPIGSTIIGHKVGDVVEVDTPDGIINFKILEIN